jgi:hypothetical protein
VVGANSDYASHRERYAYFIAHVNGKEGFKSVSNRQTQVTVDQFFALQEFPKQLEQFFQTYPLPQRVYYERRSRQYERLAVEKTRIITQPVLSKPLQQCFCRSLIEQLETILP